MPLYEYECRECGERFESLRSMSDRDRKLDCPRCGKRAAQRLPSTFAASVSSSAPASAGGACGAEGCSYGSKFG